MGYDEQLKAALEEITRLKEERDLLLDYVAAMARALDQAHKMLNANGRTVRKARAKLVKFYATNQSEPVCQSEPA